MMQYFLSLGSNINAEANINFAIEQLNKILTNTKFSSIHKTKAEGFEGDDFLNLVVAGESDLSFDDLNEKLKDIENESGRKRDVPKFSARTLDIDIVLQINEDEILYESDEIEKYSFVSEPLKEVL
jgi:2-amino-4-hydroxy-6-hydroxymethyldihydropteridine diphosphokinase